MPNAVMHKLMDLVEAVVFEGDADGDFADCAFALLALAIGRLPPEKREAMLRAIEEGGALTTAVSDLADRMPIVDDRPQGSSSAEISERQLNEAKAFKKAWQDGKI